MLLNLLATNGLQSEHEQKQEAQYAQKPKIGHPKGKPRASMKTEAGKQKAEKKEIAGHIVKGNITTTKETTQQGNTGDSLVHNKIGVSNQRKQLQINTDEQKTSSTGNSNKTATKRATLQGNPGDGLVQNKHKNIQKNAMMPKTGQGKEHSSKPKQTHEIVMKSSRTGKIEMAPNSKDVHRTTRKKSVKNLNTHNAVIEGHASRKDISSGALYATGSIAADSDLIRRSEEASRLLLQGNPNITDLSDNNRPAKLAERFSELYSNEYTDAFEELEMKQISERDIIQILLNIVTNAYIYCQRKAKDELTRLQVEVERDLSKQAYSSENVESLWKRQVAKGLKESGLKIKGNICQNFIGEEPPKILRAPALPIGKKISTYANSSVEIVWLTCIQDPPLSMKWTEEKNNKKEFDTDLYRFYTKSGNYVEYYVWPVLRLYDGGPLLTKGIAQGK